MSDLSRDDSDVRSENYDDGSHINFCDVKDHNKSMSQDVLDVMLEVAEEFWAPRIVEISKFLHHSACHDGTLELRGEKVPTHCELCGDAFTDQVGGGIRYNTLGDHDFPICEGCFSKYSHNPCRPGNAHERKVSHTIKLSCYDCGKIFSKTFLLEPEEDAKIQDTEICAACSSNYI